MRSRTRHLLVITLTAVPCALTAAQPPSDLASRIDAFVQQRITADSFSGAILVARDGRVVYERAAGLANRETSEPMSLDTKIQIASATKLFTQIAIRQLEQAGKLSLGDTVGRFLPDYPNPLVRARVTVEQLLRHRSGVGSFWNTEFMARRADIRTVDDYIGLFARDSLLFEPGTGEAYSNGGYVILGAIIERMSGKQYHDYLRDHVFGPAGMTETVPYDRTVPRKNAATGYTLQMLDAPLTGDRRLAGPGDARPGYGRPAGASSDSQRTQRAPGDSQMVRRARGDSQPARRAPGDTAAAAGSGMRMRLIGPDGRMLTPEEAQQARARRAAAGGSRRPNTAYQPGVSSPAGDHYSTVGDFLRLADALLSHRLLDSTRTTAVLGARYAAGTDFRANGGGPGVNAEFSIFPSGDVMVVLSNMDPPSATTVAQFIRSLLAP